MEKIVNSKIKCPRCNHGRHLFITEIWDGHGIEWEQIDGKFDINDGSLTSGDPYRLDAKCKCGHRWKIKGATQIGDAHH